MPTVDDFVDYYALLQVEATASVEQIETAIRDARRLWTKRQGGSNPERRHEAVIKIGQLDEAEKILKDEAKRAEFDERRANWRPPATPAAGSDPSRDWPALALQYLAEQNPHSANYAAREAISINGSDHLSWWVRAHSSFLMGKPDDAEYEFNEAIRLQPQNAEYHHDLGDAFAAQNKWTSALRAYEKALSLKPGNVDYKTAIANVYLVNNQPERALTLMEEVVSADPSTEAFQYYLAWAIHDTTMRKWSQMKSGGYNITSEAQVEYTINAAQRALALRFNDARMRSKLMAQLAFAEESRQMKWVHSTHMLAYLGGLLISLFMFLFISVATFIGFMGLVGLVVIIWAYWTRHYKPAWKHWADSGQVAKAGI